MTRARPYFWGMAFLFPVACSSSPTPGLGGSTSTSWSSSASATTGAFMTTGATGTGSSTATGTTATTTSSSGGGACLLSGNACVNTCLPAKCNTQFMTCNKDMACASAFGSFVNCVCPAQMSGDRNAQNVCIGMFAKGPNETAVIDCIQQNCNTQCLLQ